MNQLNVKKVTKSELSEKWGFYIGSLIRSQFQLYIRCNAKGKINWDKAPVYNSQEIDAIRRLRIVNIVE